MFTESAAHRIIFTGKLLAQTEKSPAGFSEAFI